MPFSPFKLERYFAQYEFKTEYMLSSSDCESVHIRDLLSLEPDAAERFHEHWLGYTESSGAPSLRQQISQIYTTIQPEQVLVHTGAEEAIFLYMHAMLSPGDHVIVHWPGYQSLYEVALGLGCRVTQWPARVENGWALDLDELKRSMRPNTRLVIINNPHNPTGYLMPQSDYREMIELIEKRGVRLFSDEVYRESEYQLDDRLPAAADLSDHAASLGVLSKTYGLAGLRIGWIAAHDPQVYQRMASLKDYTTICNSAPSEFLAELALRHRAQLTARNLQIIQANLRLMGDFFTRRADHFEWQPPKAGSVAFPRLLQGDIETFCRDLVTQAGVLLVPGTLFDYPGHHFRVGLGRQNMPQALQRLDEFCDGYDFSSIPPSVSAPKRAKARRRKRR